MSVSRGLRVIFQTSAWNESADYYPRLPKVENARAGQCPKQVGHLCEARKQPEAGCCPATDSSPLLILAIFSNAGVSRALVGLYFELRFIHCLLLGIFFEQLTELLAFILKPERSGDAWAEAFLLSLYGLHAWQGLIFLTTP